MQLKKQILLTLFPNSPISITVAQYREDLIFPLSAFTPISGFPTESHRVTCTFCVISHSLVKQE